MSSPSQSTSPRCSPDISDIVQDGKIFRFNKYWCCPKQMINRPWLSAWELNVKNYPDFIHALDAAHALHCVHTLCVSYSDGHYVGTCVVPNDKVKSIYTNE